MFANNEKCKIFSDGVSIDNLENRISLDFCFNVLFTKCTFTYMRQTSLS